MQHVQPQPYEDSFGIGQRQCAEIQLQAAEKELAATAADAFSPAYVPEKVRESARRRFYAARAEYERAKTILNTWEEVA